MFYPLCGSGMVQANPSRLVLICPNCKREGPASIDEAALEKQQPFVRECVNCHGAILIEDTYCRKCGTNTTSGLLDPSRDGSKEQSHPSDPATNPGPINRSGTSTDIR